MSFLRGQMISSNALLRLAPEIFFFGGDIRVAVGACRRTPGTPWRAERKISTYSGSVRSAPVRRDPPPHRGAAP